MKWFVGTVQAAVKKALDEKKIFIVYIQGEDENSKKMDETWTHNEVASCCTEENCVAIRINAGSVEVEQFSKCYPVLCIPSTYFINELGIPVDIVAGFVEPVKFLERIKGVVKQEDSSHKEGSQQSIAAANNDDHDNSSLKPPLVADSAHVESASSITGPQDTNPSQESEEEIKRRIANAKDLIQKRREEKEKQEIQERIEKEKKRREEQKNLELAKQKQKEEETNKLLKERAIDKAQAKAAREDILKKIQQDKMEKAARYEGKKQQDRLEIENRRKAKEQALANSKETASSERLTSKIQFRFPDGSTLNKEYPSRSTLKEVMDSFIQETSPRFDNVCFATLYPKRQFDATEMNSSLKDLNLVPSAVLIVIPQRQATSVKSSNGMLDFLLFVLTPIISLLTIIKIFIFGDKSSQDSSNVRRNDSSKGKTNNDTNAAKLKANSGGAQERSSYEKTGNVFKFTQDQEDDDEDKKTWNGNSTQQM